MRQRRMQEARWASRWRGVASNEGAGKLKEGERNDNEHQKEGEGIPDTGVWVDEGAAFIRGGLTKAMSKRHCNKTNLRIYEKTTITNKYKRLKVKFFLIPVFSWLTTLNTIRTLMMAVSG